MAPPNDSRKTPPSKSSIHVPSGRHSPKRATSDEHDEDARSVMIPSSPPPRVGSVPRLRPARYSGQLYPADSSTMRAAIARASSGDPGEYGHVAGIVVPHGPMNYCGAVVAAATNRVVLEETVVILAPNHAGRGPRGAIAAKGAYAMAPTGPSGTTTTVDIDGVLAESIRGLAGITEAPEAFVDEHAIEVTLPYLLARRSELSIVPILFHDVSPAAAARMGVAIAGAIIGIGRATLVATTNLAHYVERTRSRDLSARLLAAAAELDADKLMAILDDERRTNPPLIEVCGLSALLVAIHALRTLGAQPGIVVAEGSSSDIDGATAAVGYGSIVYPARSREGRKTV